jgi:hypothetical protein
MVGKRNCPNRDCSEKKVKIVISKLQRGKAATKTKTTPHKGGFKL